MKVLLGDISSYKAIAVARFISKNYPDIIIYSFDNRKFTNAIQTKYIYKNLIIEKDNIESYIEVIDKYEVDLFIPVINESLNIFWKYKDRFNKTLNYLGEFSTYQILNDKSQLHNLAKKLNILVPEKYTDLSSAKLPFIIKPTNLSSAKGVIYVKKRSDIPNNFSSINTIIQQYITGVGVGYSFYCKNGKIVDGYGHKRLAEYPISGGSSTYRTSYDDKRMYEIADKIVKKLNYTGFAMFEYKLTPDDELYLLEVNPRIWGSINQGLANGTNYFEEILGLPIKQVNKNRTHVNTYLGPLIYLSFLKYLFKLNLNPILIFIKNLANNVADVNIIRDPKGYLSTILRKLN